MRPARWSLAHFGTRASITTALGIAALLGCGATEELHIGHELKGNIEGSGGEGGNSGSAGSGASGEGGDAGTAGYGVGGSSVGGSDNSGGSNGSCGGPGVGGSAGSDTGGSGGMAGSDDGSDPDEGCAIDGTYALQLSVPVSWQDNGVVGAGSGTIEVALRALFTQKGESVLGVGDVCGLRLPWYDGEGYEVDFDEYWLPKQIPGVKLQGRTSGSVPDQTLELDRFAVLLGVELKDATTAPWPVWRNIVPVDHDADAMPGYTVLGAYDTGALPFPLDAEKIARTERALFAVRVVANLKAKVVNCGSVTGESALDHLNLTPIGCSVSPQKPSTSRQDERCTDAQTDYLGAWMAHYEVGAPRARLQRMTDGVNCEDVRWAQ